MTDKIRLAICTHCGSVEEMPPYEGPWQQDHFYNNLLENHMPHAKGRTVHVADIDADTWRDPAARNSVLAKLPEEVGMPGSGQGLGQTFYDMKSTFTEDAFKCWAVEHNRTKNCEDYRSDKKRLLPDTKADRRELGLDPKTRPNTFLCDFCPYNSIVMQRSRKDKFGYDYTT